MKIAVIGAAGKAGNLIVEEAVKRGHEVTAIVRKDKGAFNPAVKVLEEDLFELKYEDIHENEVVIDAFGTWEPDTLILHQTSLKYLADLLSGKENRLMVVGSAGSLYLDKEHTLRLVGSPDMPEMFKPLATNMCKAFDELKVRTDVRWTYVSPSVEFIPDGVRTGKYVLGSDELMVNNKGESRISYADYAIAMLDEAESGKYIQKRFTVVSQ